MEVSLIMENYFMAQIRAMSLLSAKLSQPFQGTDLKKFFSIILLKTGLIFNSIIKLCYEKSLKHRVFWTHRKTMKGGNQTW